MGQKINPIGLRLGINRGWDSTWFAKKKDFGKFLIEDFKIRNYIKKNIINSGVSEIIIERSSKKSNGTVFSWIFKEARDNAAAWPESLVYKCNCNDDTLVTNAIACHGHVSAAAVAATEPAKPGVKPGDSNAKK